MLEKERLRCIKESNLFLCSRSNKRANIPRTRRQEEGREKESKRLRIDTGASSTLIHASYRDSDLLDDTMVSPVLPLGQCSDPKSEVDDNIPLVGGVNGSLEDDCVPGAKKKTNISDNSDGMNLTPPPKLSESTEDKKLLGLICDISKALASNNIVDPALEDNVSRPVFDNALYKRFSRVQESVNNQAVSGGGHVMAAGGDLEGVDTSEWSQGSDFSLDEKNKEIVPTETSEFSFINKKCELSVSPNTPVGPLNKGHKNKEVQLGDGSPILRTLIAREDANSSLMSNTRGRCHTLSNFDNIAKTPNMNVSRSSSVGDKTRKKAGAKQRLIPGQALLPTMFSGLFKPSTGAGYVKKDEGDNNKVVWPDEINKQ